MMDMDMSVHGTPWLEAVTALDSSREYTCDLNQTSQCLYQQGYWRFWYKADLRYARPTVAFFMAVIALFAVGYLLNQIFALSASQAKPVRKAIGLSRYFAYRSVRISVLDWNSAPIGLLMLGGVGVIYFFCMILAPKPYYWPNTETLSFGDSPPLATRSGWLSIACMPFVFATAGKSNFITAITGISHEKLQIFHRWIAYAFFITALMHTFPFIVYNIKMGEMVMNWQTDSCYWTGVVAILAQAWLTFASSSPLRNLCYEWFKFSHFVAALVFIVFFFLHCDFILTSADYFIVTGVLFSLSWLHRQIRIYFEHGVGQKATLTIEPNGFIRVTVPTKSTWRAGQHYFVRFLCLGLHAWSIHPFTACSLPERGSIFDPKTSQLVFFIRPRTGFTGRLARYVESHPECQMRVLLDGPYGGIDMRTIENCRRSLVMAGGSGAGWLLPLIMTHLRRLQLSSDATEEKINSQPSMRVILATRDLATRSWFEESIQSLLVSYSMDKHCPGLEVEVYYTGSIENLEAPNVTGQFLQQLAEPEKADHPKEHLVETTTSGSGSSSKLAQSVRSIDRRPDLPAVIRSEAASSNSRDPLGVYVCGPLSMQSDVSNAVAQEQLEIVKSGSKDIYLHMEHFSWA